MSAIEIQVAKDGNPVPLWDGFVLHSVYNPVKEGHSLADVFLKSLDTPASSITTPLLVLGLGFGYHILPLLDRFSHIYIAESNRSLVEKARDLESLQPLFEKCVLIDDVGSAPYLSEYHLYTLRAEVRFQEKFFDDVQVAVKIANKGFKPAPNQLRVLVNSPVYGGSYTTAQYVVSALQALGVSVHFTDHSVANALLQKYLQNPSVNANLIEQLTSLLSETVWQDILDFKPHIVFFVAQSPFTDKLMKAVHSAGIVSMYWFVEDFRRMHYWSAVCNSFDYFFMIQKGEFEQMLDRTCRKIYGWSPTAAEPSVHKPVQMTAEQIAFYGSDISFMGAAYPNRVRFFERMFSSSGASFKLWGTGWSDSAIAHFDIPLKDQRISIEQSNMIYQATKININLHSSNDGITDSAMFDAIGDFVNPRTFEIAAAGGFQLVDDREAVRELFEADKEIVFFSSVAEAIDKANFYLKNEAQRKEIARNAQEKVLKYHTYEKRLSNMLSTAIQYSPGLSARIASENDKLGEFMKLINDGDFEKFINRFEPATRSSYQKIINEIKQSTGDLKSYEAFLMLLDTFYTGE